MQRTAQPLLLVMLAVTAMVVTTMAEAQPAPTIGLDTTVSGVIPTEEIEHAYVLDLPAGVPAVTIAVTAFGDDADMAVYYGPHEEELYYDISTDPYPRFTMHAPRPGLYRVVVLNLLWQPLRYELHVSTTGAPSTATSEASGPGADAPALTLARRVAAPSESLRIDFSGAPGNAGDWIGLYREGAEDRQYLTYQYTRGLRSGSLSFELPSEPGRYAFRLFENDGYDRLAVSSVFAVGATPPPPAPAVSAVVIPCERRANQSPLAELEVGASLALACPAGCDVRGPLWGTDVYTHDSAVCLAARHAGVIGEAGGSFVITMASGQGSYEASTRNGVTSARWGNWGTSFSVSAEAPVARPSPAAAPVQDPAAGVLFGTWQLNANGHRGTLRFDAAGDGWRGTFTLSGREEELADISYDGVTLRFTRPLGTSTQEYVGELVHEGSTLRVSGNFYQGAARTVYRWSAERSR